MKINAKKKSVMNEILSVKTGSVELNFPFACRSSMAWSGTGTNPVFTDTLFFMKFLHRL